MALDTIKEMISTWEGRKTNKVLQKAATTKVLRKASSPELRFQLSDHNNHPLPPFSRYSFSHSTFPQESSSHSPDPQCFRLSIAMMAGAQPAVKVVALCGSLRKNSTNRGLIRAGNRTLSLSLSLHFSVSVLCFFVDCSSSRALIRRSLL